MRHENWPERLLETIERHRQMPFGWGTSDCFTYPMDCVEAMTGTDPLRNCRTYSTELGAGKVLRRHMVTNVGDLFAAVFPEIPVALAQRGDIGVAEYQGLTAGVVFIGASALGKAESGLQGVARSLVTRAFKVE